MSGGGRSYRESGIPARSSSARISSTGSSGLAAALQPASGGRKRGRVRSWGSSVSRSDSVRRGACRADRGRGAVRPGLRGGVRRAAGARRSPGRRRAVPHSRRAARGIRRRCGEARRVHLGPLLAALRPSRVRPAELPDALAHEVRGQPAGPRCWPTVASPVSSCGGAASGTGVDLLSRVRKNIVLPLLHAHYRRRHEHGDWLNAARRHLLNRFLGRLRHCLQTRKRYDEQHAFGPLLALRRGAGLPSWLPEMSLGARHGSRRPQCRPCPTGRPFSARRAGPRGGGARRRPRSSPAWRRQRVAPLRRSSSPGEPLT
ncbi:hypothetical protein SAMN05444921_12310 [Streptomyces wuyuanensis]|uniref:Transposase IS116/IS110/IS902 family protein n=1 Tax=Streptomyces wuyuanensis TaxID=1196353 RepID=A0A1G9ZZK8_9ACTN|nr:hypothetical protein SAMN05444921_12310 [Streptomyces wuyuanensis]